MYGTQAARSGASTRIPDLLEQLKSEYDALGQESTLLKAQKEDFERKLESQIAELNMMTQTLTELERQHRQMKNTYEDEIKWLKRQIESAGGVVQPRKDGAGMPSVASKVEGTQSSALPSCFGTAAAHSALADAIPNSQIMGDTPMANATNTSAGEPSKAVDSKGRQLDDWNVVHNPNATSKMHIELCHTLEHDSVVCCVRFSNDGRYVATGCNKTAVLYEAETGKRLGMFSNEGVLDSQVALDNLTCGDSYVRSVCFSPDSRYLVAGAEDKTIKVWDIQGRRLRHSLQGHSKDIYSVDYSSDGRYIVSGSGDKRAKLWDVASGECILTFGDDDGPKDGVTSVAVSPDCRYIAAGSLDRLVRLWDIKTGKLIDKFDGHNDSVYSVSFSPDVKYLASGSLDKTLKLWDLSATGNRTVMSKCKHTFQGHKDFVLSVVFAMKGSWLISGSKDRSVQFWDPRRIVAGGQVSQDEGPVLILQGHLNSVISVAHSPSSFVFATGSGDKRARIWKYRET
uniref:Transcriptional repressor Tup1 N-terminal domain-containing protein n=1 Tax=Guillardia theta TaxID=55529 RepID=A0A7S4KSA0_GUITH|mmetsp:Transcript_30125/g.96905  ORF Transcript_30125/g.96905 Transcript_30125/m.96905 type:complete len:512 (+) Transcript_30125:176-1711(+)